MKYIHLLYLVVFFLSSCIETLTDEKATEVTDEINKINQSIEENTEKIEGLTTNHVDDDNLDGPYPANQYSLDSTGKFYFQALHCHREDSVWLTIAAKSEKDIVEKYANLQVFKIRPSFMSRDQWMKSRRDCIKKKLVFDLSDEPKGWLLENKHYLN